VNAMRADPSDTRVPVRASRSKIRHEDGDWTRFRNLPGLGEVDFHRSGVGYGGHHDAVMAGISDELLEALQEAKDDGTKYVLFTHGSSTSEGWKKRTACVQHSSVFLAAIRQKGRIC